MRGRNCYVETLDRTELRVKLFPDFSTDFPPGFEIRKNINFLRYALKELSHGNTRLEAGLAPELVWTL
jgi:hypothetical protein